MEDRKKIIVVEDNPDWFDKFKEMLLEFGEKRAIERYNLEDFFGNFQRSCDLDDVEYIFVDIELGPSSTPQRHDKYGLDRILPVIKKLAHWIPVACISRFITGDSTFIGELSHSDFDGIYPKEIITDGELAHPSFNKNSWENILNSLSISRISNLTGLSKIDIQARLKNNKFKLRISEPLKKTIKKYGKKEFAEGLSLLGFNPKSIMLDDNLIGFSKINVNKLSIYDDENCGDRSFWLLKWGMPTRKLSDEIAAHKRVMRSGLYRRLQVPLLYDNVIFWKGIGFICYTFEEGTQTALEYINKYGIEKYSTINNIIVDCLYKSKKPTPINVKQEIKRIWNIEVEKEGINCQELTRPLEVTYSFIHGDFHLRNILIKDSYPLLIDFAKSTIGPVVLDLAKLTIDILAFKEKANITKDLFNKDFLKNTMLKPISKKFASTFKSLDDMKFYQIAICFYAHQYLKYPDVPTKVKNKFKTILDSVSFYQ